MKIALVAPFPDRDAAPRGGVESVACQLAGYLTREGHDCHVIAVGSRTDGFEARTPLLSVYRVRAGWLPGALTYPTIVAAKVRRLIEAIKPAITHVHGSAVWAAVCPAPAVLTIHGFPEYEIALRHPRLGRAVGGVVRQVEEQALKHVENVILINPYVEQLRPIGPGHRAWYVPNAIDALFFDDDGSDQRSDTVKRLLWVGSNGAGKNLLAFIELVSELCRIGVPVVADVVGVELNDSSDYIARCRRGLNAGNAERAIRFRGRQPSHVIRQYMDAAAALVITSIRENAPCVVSEALARGLYIVAPRDFGLPYMIQDERHGVLYTPGTDARTLAAIVLDALKSEEWCMVAERRRAARAFHPEHVGRSTLQVYREILHGA